MLEQVALDFAGGQPVLFHTLKDCVGPHPARSMQLRWAHLTCPSHLAKSHTGKPHTCSRGGLRS